MQTNTHNLIVTVQKIEQEIVVSVPVEKVFSASLEIIDRDLQTGKSTVAERVAHRVSNHRLL